MPAPAEFIIPDVGNTTAQKGVLNAVVGSRGTQLVRFFMHKEYDDKSSRALGKEVFKPIEMVAFKNDQYSEYTCRVEDMTEEQRIGTAELYQRFLEQKDSNETAIEAWELVSEGERNSLLRQGYKTVEQIAAHGEHELYRLGVSGRELRDRALRHVMAKEENNKRDVAAEMRAIVEQNKLIAEENANLRKDMEAAQELYFQTQQQIAALEKSAKAKGK